MPEPRWAISLELPGLSLPEHEPILRAAEAAGYTDAWTGETGGHDGFTPLAMAAAWTDRMRLGTGVVNVFTRGPAVLAQHAAALQDASRGRFCLGVGSSSNVIVEKWNGGTFEKPRTRVRETVAFLRAALAGERAGEGRFRLEQPPSVPVPIHIAALRERMLRTAGELGDGAWVNFLPRQNLETVLGEIRAGEREAGKETGATEVLCRFFCLQGDPEEALPLARWMFAAYATVPVYEAFFRWLGHGEAIDPMVSAWREGDRAKAVEAAPRELIEDIFILGDADAQRARLESYRAGGVTTPVLMPIPLAGPDGSGSVEEMGTLVESLAPA
jgi:probable F420-dependent oxidoreductase